MTGHSTQCTCLECRRSHGHTYQTDDHTGFTDTDRPTPAARPAPGLPLDSTDDDRDSSDDANDLHDLICLDQAGTSVLLPTPLPATITVPDMPRTRVAAEAPDREEALRTAAGFYDAGWLTRRNELNDMLALENEGVSVTWHDPDDRKAIVLANHRDITEAIALQLRPTPAPRRLPLLPYKALPGLSTPLLEASLGSPPPKWMRQREPASTSFRRGTRRR